MLNGMVRWAVLMSVTALALVGCAQSLEEQAHDRLQEDLDGVHESFLDRRARDPETTGRPALRTLDRYGDAIEATVDDDEITLVWGIAASASETHGSYKPTTTTASVGACVRVVIRIGEGDRDRGTVRTEPVRCPAGTELLDDEGYPVDAETTDLDGREGPVPEPPYDRPVCHSGGDCSRGGG